MAVEPENWDLFNGESGTSLYTVAVTQTGYTDSDWAVSGTITVENTGIVPAELTGVTDSVNGIAADVNCGVDFPHTLAPDASLECSYSADLPDGSNRINTATAWVGALSFTGTEDVIFGDPTTEVNATVNVDDTFAGDLGSFSDSGWVSYTRTFTCGEDAGEHENIATIVETGQSDDASVTVNCYELTVRKDAETSFDRTYEWTIEKDVDEPGPHHVAPGEEVTVEYSVTVDVEGFTDSNHAVSGNIDISNPHPSRNADLTDVRDVVSPDIIADVNCPSLTVPAGGSLSCTYSADLPDGTDRINTATATQQLYDFDEEGAATLIGTADHSGEAGVIFGDDPANEFDTCVDVTDDPLWIDEFEEFLGTVCVADAPRIFTYERTLTASGECGDEEFVNTADFVTNDTGATGEDSATVTLRVACEGCTPGFWQGGKGARLWNEEDDPDWTAAGGNDTNPFIHTTRFNDYFEPYGPVGNLTMFDLVSTGGGPNAWRRAARNVVAAYLNASFGMAGFPYMPEVVADLWKEAVDGERSFQEVHELLGAANDPEDGYCPL